MAKPPDGRKTRRPTAPTKTGAETEQEEVGPELEGPEREKNTAQEQVGNAALAALLSQGGMDGDSGDDAGGRESSQARRKQGDKDGRDYGGDDDVVDDGPLTIDDLTSSWNPGTRKSEDHAQFLEPMPDDELPPEDPAFFIQVKSWPTPLPLSPDWSVDALLQPSPQVVAASLHRWAAGIARFADPSLTWRTISWLLRPPAPILQDPNGRVLLARTRGATIATWMLLRSPTMRDGATTATAALVDFLLEMEGRRHRVHGIRVAADRSGKKIPLALRLFHDNFTGQGGRVRTGRFSVHARAWVLDTLESLMDLPAPRGMVPSLELSEAIPEEDGEHDPLGLDDVLAEFTGGRTDPEDALYQAAVQAAERLASVCAQTRVRGAGLSLVVAEVASQWSSGAPLFNLEQQLEGLDRDVAAVLQLLVEIARAAQRKQVPPPGLRSGLSRAAKRLARATSRFVDGIADIVGGIVPGTPELPEPSPVPNDGLEQAMRSGEPRQAVAWLRRQPQSSDRDAAIVFAELCAGKNMRQAAAPLQHVREQALKTQDVALASVCDILLGGIALATRDTALCEQVAARQLELGSARRNGLIIANAAIIHAELAHLRADVQGREDAITRAGNLLWRMGASGALSMLARWRPPLDEIYPSDPEQHTPR